MNRKVLMLTTYLLVKIKKMGLISAIDRIHLAW